MTRPIAEHRERLASLARLAEQLHPDRPLARGYVRVTGAAGRTVTTRAQASTEAALELHFADGTLAVSPAGAGAKPRVRKSGTSTRQDDLFG